MEIRRALFSRPAFHRLADGFRKGDEEIGGFGHAERTLNQTY